MYMKNKFNILINKNPNRYYNNTIDHYNPLYNITYYSRILYISNIVNYTGIYLCKIMK
jgi:hypothetical protein